MEIQANRKSAQSNHALANQLFGFLDIREVEKVTTASMMDFVQHQCGKDNLKSVIWRCYPIVKAMDASKPNDPDQTKVKKVLTHLQEAMETLANQVGRKNQCPKCSSAVSCSALALGLEKCLEKYF